MYSNSLSGEVVWISITVWVLSSRYGKSRQSEALRLLGTSALAMNPENKTLALRCSLQIDSQWRRHLSAPYKMEDYILTTLHLLGDSKYQVYPLIGIQLTAVGDVLLVRIETQSLFPILRAVFDFELLDVHTALYNEGLLLWDSPTHVFASNRFVDGHESLECWELCDLSISSARPDDRSRLCVSLQSSGFRLGLYNKVSGSSYNRPGQIRYYRRNWPRDDSKCRHDSSSLSERPMVMVGGNECLPPLIRRSAYGGQESSLT